MLHIFSMTFTIEKGGKKKQGIVDVFLLNTPLKTRERS